MFMTLKAFCNEVKVNYVHVLIDYTTAVATLNHMGTNTLENAISLVDQYGIGV